MPPSAPPSLDLEGPTYGVYGEFLSIYELKSKPWECLSAPGRLRVTPQAKGDASQDGWKARR